MLASEIIRALANTREKVTLIVEKVKVRAGGICTSALADIATSADVANKPW